MRHRMNDHHLLQIVSLLCGIALFLYGMQQGEKTLKRLGVGRLRQIIAAITRNRFAGYVTGIITTLITQSSSATTVMLVGLASVQLMTLRQALGVILGSDLGTTMTLQLFAFKFYLISPILIVTGFGITMLWKSGPTSMIGKIVLAIGFVFYGMQLMAEASGSLRDLPVVSRFVRDSFLNPWIGLAAGICITAIVQSSAAMLAMVIVLAPYFTGGDLVTPGLSHFLPIVLGANIGTCSTAFLAILQAETEGVRVAWAHLLFKIIGSALALPFFWILKDVAVLSSWPVALQIAALHTAFNIYIALIFLPLVPLFDRMIRRIVKPSNDTRLRFHTQYIHERVLSIPVLALSQATREISRTAEIVARMVEAGLESIKRFNYSLRMHIIDLDDEVDFLHETILAYLTRIAREELGIEEAKRASMLIMVTTDLEHIGDIVSKNLVELAGKIDRSPVPLSTEGKQEITDFYTATATLLREALAAFAANDRELAGKTFDCKSDVRVRFSSYVDYHMDRLYKHKVQSLQITSIHIDLLEEINRINHFTFRIAEHVLKA
jgi:phosphate:Na+ symporter